MNSKSRQNSNVANRLSVADRTELLTKKDSVSGYEVAKIKINDKGLVMALIDFKLGDIGSIFTSKIESIIGKKTKG